jgi:hypothetical protein
MHRALFLPEIIGTILRTESSCPGFLHTCLFINSAFSLEAIRILWEGCGARYNSGTGHGAPEVKDLARIILRNPYRGQFYANFIRILMFGEEDESNNFLGEARWHRELLTVQFPQLEEIGLYESDDAATMNTGDVVRRFSALLSTISPPWSHSHSQIYTYSILQC